MRMTQVYTDVATICLRPLEARKPSDAMVIWRFELMVIISR